MSFGLIEDRKRSKNAAARRTLLHAADSSWSLAPDLTTQPAIHPEAELHDLTGYLQDCREVILREIRSMVPERGVYAQHLYDLMLEYPLREGKALRPALCIATCRALGGGLEAVARSAAVLEMYHNAFLIHDDVEDGSEKRRDQPTLHRQYGTAIAINVGDAMLALTLQPLLDNMRVIGMGSALRVLQIIARMARESAEGQSTELAWIRDAHWDVTDRDYFRMVHKKTSWYTFIAPMLIGATIAGASEQQLGRLWRLATLMGMAFQIQDDVLNLVGDEKLYGKEILGDLWEGKHTLILVHALRRASVAERARARAILLRRRPAERGEAEGTELEALIERLAADGELTAFASEQLRGHWRSAAAEPAKTSEDVAFLMALVERHGSVDYARRAARARARRARAMLARAAAWKAPSIHYDFLQGVVGFILERDR
jgi:geranylgeranyl diphosphate synthase, type II